jgi:transcriptional regulator with XRE-family HTH domain
MGYTMNVSSSLEEAIRAIVREELDGRRFPMAARYALPPKAIAAAVRAELARRDLRASGLAAVLGMSKPTVSGRLNGAYEFTHHELELVAEYIGIRLPDLLESALMGERFSQAGPAADVIFEEDPVDDWAQPPRAGKRKTAW